MWRSSIWVKILFWLLSEAQAGREQKWTWEAQIGCFFSDSGEKQWCLRLGRWRKVDGFKRSTKKKRNPIEKTWPKYLKRHLFKENIK